MFIFFRLIHIILLSSYLKLCKSWCQQSTFQTTQTPRQIQVSPSTRHVAILDSTDTVKIYHTQNYQLLSTYNIGQGITVIRFSPDGSYLAVGSTDEKVRLLQGYETFAGVKTFDGLVGSGIVGIDFSKDSKNIVVCGNTGVSKLTLFTILNNGTWLNTTINLTPASSTASDCRFSPANDMIAVNTNSRIQFYNLNLTQTGQLNPNSTTFYKIKIHPLTYSLFYIESQHDKLMYEDVGSAASSVMPGNSGTLRDVDVSSNGVYIAVGGDDAEVYIYNSTRDLLLSYSLTSPITALSFATTYQHPKLFIGSSNNKITILALNCTPQCPRDYFASNSQCLFCSDYLPKCLTCLSSTICDSCLDGYYVDPNSYSCKSCPIFGCMACVNSGYCTSCQEGFYIFSDKCKRCGDSLDGCAICNSSSICVACTNDYYLDTTANVCKNCSTVTSNCLKCMNSTQCLECTVGFYLFSQSCLACSSLCLSCQNTLNNCTQCLKGFYLSSNTCLQCPANCLSCNNTQFCFQCINSMYQKTDGTCAYCVHPCKVCQNASYCIGCLQGFYISVGVCYLCSANCSTCNSSTYCSSCLAGFYLSLPSYICKACSLQYPNCQYCSSSACQSCYPGYFLNTSTLCQPCSDKMFKCERCSNILTCLSCLEGFYATGLTGNLSCRSCQPGCQTCWNFYDCKVCYKSFYLDPDLDCKPCLSNCLQCANNTVCEVCDSGYYLQVGTKLCKLCRENLDNCVQCWNSTSCSDCEVGYYLDTPTTTCKHCPPSCLTCNSINCTTCVTGYYLSLISATYYTCSPCSQSCTECTSLTQCTSCKTGLYLDSSTSTCFNCSTSRNCRTCNSITCFSCLNGFYLDDNYGVLPYSVCKRCETMMEACLQCSQAGSCEACEDGYFLDVVTKKCKNCAVMEGCQNCANQSTCQSCSPGYFVNASSLCQTCPQPCATCISPSSCLSCRPKYYLINSTCQPCQQSIQGCLLCSSPSTCTQCLNGFYLSSQNCLPCRSSLVGCLYCNSSTKCVKCQNGFYLDSATNKCQICQKTMQGCTNCLSGSQCVQCQGGYFLTSSWTGCTPCHSVLTACLQCNNFSICEICLSGYYLHTSGTCRTCNSVNDGCQLCIYSALNQFCCLKCSSGFFLSLITNQCSPCSSPGCQICHSSNPIQCITCDSGYFMNSSLNCVNCFSIMQGCDQCTNGTQCVSCQVGYFLDANKTCKLCNGQVLGCSKCLISGVSFQCLQCKSLFLLDNSTKTCIPCSKVLEGCSYCVTASQCISCSNGFFKDSNTNQCTSCTILPSCLLCSSQTSCDLCTSGYYLSTTLTNKTCIPCNFSIKYCLTCLSQTQCMTCETGYELSANKSMCEKYIVQQTEKPKDLKLITEYVDQETLVHTLMLRVGQFANPGVNITGKCELYLTNYQELRSNNNKVIHQIPLQIKQVKWLSSTSLKFTTNNPTTTLLSLSSRLLQSSSLPTSSLQNFKVSLQMDKSLINTILPDLYQTSALVLDYPLSDSEFYSTYLKHYGSEFQSYKIFGYVILGLMGLNFIHKTVKVETLSQVNHHFTGQIIPHLVAVKTVGLMFEGIDEKVFFFSQGFMLFDLPWLNQMIGNILGNKADHMPSVLSMFYTNMNIASTGMICLIVFIVLMSLRFLINNKKEKINRSKYTQLIYNLFIFSLVHCGSLSIHGSLLNPISQLSVNALFYILGILLYLSLAIQMLWSLRKDPRNNFYKLRIFAKATMLQVSYASPFVIVTMAVVVDVSLILGQYLRVERKMPNWIAFWWVDHILLDSVLIVMLVIQNSSSAIFISITIISIVVIIEFLLNCKLIRYFQTHPHIFTCCKFLSSKPSQIYPPRINRRQKVRVQELTGKEDSQQTIIQGTAQISEEKLQRLEKMWQLEEGVGDIEWNEGLTGEIYTRYKDNSKNDEFNESGLSFTSSQNTPAVQSEKSQKRKKSDVKFIKAITNKVNIRPKLNTNNHN